MELQEFISSGILESYVLGTASSQEIIMVREMEKLHPEIKKEIEQIEATLIRYSEGESGIPLAEQKRKLESVLFEKTKSVKKDNLVYIGRSGSSSSWMRYAVAASIGLLIGVSVVTFNLYTKLEESQSILSGLQMENDALSDQMGKQQSELSEKSNQLAMIMKPGSKMVALKGLSLAPESSAMIVWNPNDKEVYINAASLPMPPKGKQYQLWAMVNGKPVDAGVFVISEQGFFMQKMKGMSDAQAFAVTLENEGGSEKPTMEAMYLMGNV